MRSNECQNIINEITNNPNFVSILSPDVLLLKFLKLTGHTDIRKLLLKKKEISMPMGYLSKIFTKANIKVLHLFRINKEYYINNNYYDYIIDDNEVKPMVNREYLRLNDDDKFKITMDLIINNPDIIIVQNENAEILETNIMKYLLSKSDMDTLLLNLKTYDKSKIDNINGNKYNLDLLVTEDNKVYFNSKNNKYLYENGEIIEEDWDKSSGRPLLMIYNRPGLKEFKPIENEIYDYSLS